MRQNRQYLILWIVLAVFLHAKSATIERIQTNFKEYLLDSTQNFKQSYKALDALALTSYSVFKELPNLKQPKQLQDTLKGIADLLKLYATPRSPLYKNPQLKDNIVQALRVFAQYYPKGGLERGNWWTWEIGIPKILNEILIMGADFIPISLQSTLLQAQTYYQPNPKYSGLSEGARASSNPKPRLSQGANRVDTAFIILIRGAIEQDQAQILAALDALKSVFEIVSSGDGFYADGSFIQHQHVPSNGSYGIVFLRGLAQFMLVLDNTPFEENLIPPSLYASVLKSYPYFLIQGGLNPSVCGRSISRDHESDFSRAKALIEALATLAKHAPSLYKTPLQRLIQDALKANPIQVNHTATNKILEQIAHANLPPLPLESVRVFGAMDRVVQRGAHGGSIVLAMHSNRILNYETMNGENLKGFDTSDGMTYIYGDSKAFVDYWPLVNPTKLPGTTELAHQEEIIQRRGNLGVQSFAGGAANGHYGFVGLDLQKVGFRAQKSYLFLGDEMIALGSVQSSSPTITPLDNRKITPTDELSINNHPFNQNSRLAKKGDFINFANPAKELNIGYVVLQDAQVSIESVPRSGSYLQIGGKSARKLEASFLEMILHSTPKQNKYAYLVLPNFSPKEVQNYPIADIQIIAQTHKLHALRVRSKHLLAINKWENGWSKVGDLKIKDPLSILEITDNTHLQLSIADPTQQLKEPTKLILEGRYSLAQPNPAVQLSYKGKHTELTMQLPPLGASLVLDLARIK
ncbi:polysaccharide lyase family 8 super-sandwich domain-containing protein [Helicobacter felis]|uniref:polysaccharide lyase family 8 super-sandwich domain-containing protein n=1 Tax=Helicobacter felis TaxID=214 RepID=UPI000EF66952|nr:polysaccharide lyase family 8 super-sandwich domain-containing protein [Helicobacter felis]